MEISVVRKSQTRREAGTESFGSAHTYLLFSLF